MKLIYLASAISLAMFSSGSLAVVNQGYDLKDHYIVVLDGNTPDSRASEIAQAVAKGKGVVGHRYNFAIKGFSVRMPIQALNGLKHRFPDIDYIEPDMVVNAMPRGGKPDKGGGDSENPRATQQTPWGIDRVGGFVDMTGSNSVAWVIDTGIDSSHPDLNVDRRRGANFARGKKNNTNDGNGHGTHVAGTIAAKNDGFDVVGVAAGATVIPVRVLDNNGSGTMSGVIAGVDHVAANASAGDCANMSLGGSGFSAALDSAIKSAADDGIFFSVAVGNSSADAENFTPASTDHVNVFTISAFDSNDNFAAFSNYGPDVEYGQPGVNILSTKAGGGTVAYNGTSMAAPHFCGVILASSGLVATDGVVNNDPDGTPDPIAVRN